MVKVNVFSGIGAMSRDYKELETKHLKLMQRNAMLDAAFRTQKILRLRSYPAAFPKAVSRGKNPQHKNIATTIGQPNGKRRYNRSQLKKRIERALKRNRQADIAIFDLSKNTDYLVRHATGGIKRAIDGSHIGVPSKTVEATRGARGIRKSLRPSALLEKRSGRRGKTSFKTVVNGTPVIARRTTKDRLPIEVMYILKDQVRIPKTFKFYEDARVYNKLFEAAFAREYNFRINRVIQKKYMR